MDQRVILYAESWKNNHDPIIGSAEFRIRSPDVEIISRLNPARRIERGIVSIRTTFTFFETLGNFRRNNRLREHWESNPSSMRSVLKRLRFEFASKSRINRRRRFSRQESRPHRRAAFLQSCDERLFTRQTVQPDIRGLQKQLQSAGGQVQDGEPVSENVASLP